MEPLTGNGTSSKSVDIPQVLKPEVEKRLLRVFTALRQHDRKSRLARRVAELSAIRASSSRARVIQQSQAEEDEQEHIDTTEEDVGLQDVLGELIDDGKNPAAKPEESTVADEGRVVDDSRIGKLEEEIAEIQKTINTRETDRSGLITSADLLSALRSLNVAASKVRLIHG
ncbi:hypothetical protein PINS_up012257 [Pythium insidiosum]|nr:hypothetical protein PINS_up012257 [Pythium insidiosum]